jgi:hypothetical protein
VKPIIKHSILLLLIWILTIAAAYVVNNLFIIGFRTMEAAIAASVFALITFISMAIFFRGQTKEPESKIMHSLVAVGLKFLIELFFVFFWFFVFKKTSFSSVILFFVLYLTFTLFLIFTILKALKQRQL